MGSLPIVLDSAILSGVKSAPIACAYGGTESIDTINWLGLWLRYTGSLLTERCTMSQQAQQARRALQAQAVALFKTYAAQRVAQSK